MSSLVIEGGLVVDPAAGRGASRDLFVREGVICDGAADLGAASAPSKLDARGKWVLPGFIDLRAQLRSERDVSLALAAGVTAVLTSPEYPPFATARLRSLAAAPLTRNLEGEELGEVPEGARCLSNGFRPIARAGVLRRALQYAEPWQLLVMVHAEDLSLTGRGVLGEGAVATRLGLFGVPTATETSMVARDLEVLATVGGRLHFAHLTCARSVALVREAKQRGLKVSADVTPHHLTLDVRAAEGFSLAARVWPPLRDVEDVWALRQGLEEGTIDAVASDHQAIDLLEREHPFEQCSPGCESYLTLLERVLALDLSRERLAQVLSSSPAALLGIEGGTLVVGARADVVVIDPATRSLEATVVAGEIRYCKEGIR
jgi:dihydroorotase